MDVTTDLDEHMQRIIAVQFNPRTGAPYWLERQRKLGINAMKDIHTFDDLKRLGDMEEEALARRPVLDFVPLSERNQLEGAIITETGGTTGAPKRTIFSRNEFHAAFVAPFVRMAEHVGFPRDGAWLYAGPSGPHVIGQAAVACATAWGGHQPFAIDFDPRWFRILPAETIGRDRYIQHLLEQAMSILRTEPIEVIFTTPVMLERLAIMMTVPERERIRGVHYGGMVVERALLQQAQCIWFPNAVHLAGYGNSLFGVCMEGGGSADRTLRYYPHGLRHQVRVAEDGTVWMYRLDRTVLIANMKERDVGVPAHPSAQLCSIGFGKGVEGPSPHRQHSEPLRIGIY